MNQPQEAIFNEQSNSYHHLEYTLKDHVYLADIHAALQIALRKQSDNINIVVAFGRNATNTLLPELHLPLFTDFNAICSPNGKKAPATQGDLMFWIHSDNANSTLDQAIHIQSVLSDIATTKLDIPGFQYHHNRDLIGFINNANNPKDDDCQLITLIQAGQPGEGGCFVISQKWVHDLTRFNAMSIPEQEAVIGRSKETNIVLSDDARLANSHASRTDVSGVKIYRRSSPYGNASEHGLYFLAFACEQSCFTILLQRMYGVTDGITDRLIDFSDAVTGSYWFAPSQTELDKLFS